MKYSVFSFFFFFLGFHGFAAEVSRVIVDYTSTGQEVHARTADLETDIEIRWDFSTSTPLLDTRSRLGLGGKIYGGAHVTAFGGASAVLREHRNGFLNVAASGNGEKALQVVFLWQKDDFLQRGPVRFDPDSSISFNIRRFESDYVDGRIVVKEGDQFFISEYAADSDGSYSLEDPASSRWATFDPVNYSWESNYRSREFSNVQAVGLFAIATRSAAYGSALFNVDQFQVIAAVPEAALETAETETDRKVVDVGHEGDEDYIRDGFYPREGPHAGARISFFRENTFRWSQNRWTFELPVFPSEDNRVRLSARFSGELILKTDNNWALIIEGFGDRLTEYEFVLPAEAVGQSASVVLEGALMSPFRPADSRRETAFALASAAISPTSVKAGDIVASRLTEGPEEDLPLPFRLSGVEHRPPFIDVEAYADRARLYRTNVSYIGPMDGPHRTNFPTEYGFPRADLDPDYIPEKIAALHRHGMAVIGWVPFTVQTLQRIEDYQPALKYPQWTMEFIEWPDLAEPEKERVAMCLISTPWRDIHTNVLKEVSALGLDGIFFDGVFLGGQPDPVAPGCICQTCQELFQSDTGFEAPKKVDWSDMTFRRWVRWRNEKFLEIVDQFVDGIREVSPGLPVTFNWNTWPHATKRWETAVPMWSRTGHGVSQHAFSRRAEMEWINLGFKARLSHDMNPSHSDIWRRSRPHWRDFSGTDADLERFEMTMRTFMLTGISYGTTPWYGGGPIQPMNAGIRVHEAVRERENFFSQEALRHIGVIVSQNTHDFYGHLPGTNNMEDYRDAVLGTWLLLTENQAPFNLVFDNQIDADFLSEFAVLLLPDAACLSDEMVAEIGEYLDQGGKVVATGNAGAYDEWAQPREGNPLRDLHGITRFDGEPGREWLRDRDADAAHRLLESLEPGNWPLQVDAPEWLVANAFWAPDRKGKTIWVHLLNLSGFYPGGDTGFRGVSGNPVYPEGFSRTHRPIDEVRISVRGFSPKSARMGVSGRELSIGNNGSIQVGTIDIHDVLIIELK